MEKTMDSCSRRPHKKSRNGCSRCKKRKIKCDERQPSCTNCIKHSVECDFAQRSSTTPWGSPAPFSPFAAKSPHDSNNTPQNTPRSAVEISQDGQIILPLNMLDLELLHHFCTSTCHSFYTNPTLKTLWQINIPQLALSHDYVMRGILALSALHLARFKLDRRDSLLAQASTYHQLALRKATSILPHMTDENCAALYIFSTLVFMFNLAKPRDPADFLVIGDSGIADWLILFRGTRFIIETSHALLEKSVLSPMFIEGGKRAALLDQLSRQETTVEERINELRQVVQQGSAPDDQEIYAGAIDELRKSFCVAFNRDSLGLEIADVFIWVFRVSEDYLLLLHQRKPEALVIFAHFCVVLQRLESNWWVHGWSAHLMARIYHLLDEEHRLWIRWPIEEIGWVPA